MEALRHSNRSRFFFLWIATIILGFVPQLERESEPLAVMRENVETAAVVTRVAPSFLRFGHFEHFTHTANDVAALRRLVDAVIDRYFPACRDA